MNKITNNTKRVVFSAILIVIITLPLATAFSAPNNYTLLEPLPCVDPSTGCTLGQEVKTVNFQGYVNFMFNLFIAVSAVTAVFMIVLGGFQYMTSDAIKGKEDGRERLKNAVVGLLLILCSYLILRTINPKFVAIPESLVPELVIDRSDKTSKEYFSALNKTIAREDAQSVASMINAQNARDAVETLNNRLEELEVERNYALQNNDSQGLEAIDAQKEELERQKIEQQQIAIIEEARSRMSALVSSSAAALDPLEYKTGSEIENKVVSLVNSIDTSTLAQRQNLQEAGINDPNAISMVNDHGQVAKANIYTSGALQLLRLNPRFKLDTFFEYANISISQISDADMRKKATDNLLEAQAEAKEVQKYYQ